MMEIHGTETGRFSSGRPTQPQGETIDECIDDVIHGLTNNGPGGVKELQHQSDLIVYPVMISTINRLADLAHLFGWERLALDLDGVVSMNRNGLRGQAIVPSGSDIAQIAVQEQEAWIRQCGATIEGYVKKYGSTNDDNSYGNGGEAIFEADIRWLNKLRKLAGIPPRDGL